MTPLTEAEIRASFVNCTKGEAKRLAVPRDLADRRWAELDFFGWRDPGAPERAYLVAERGQGPFGVALRLPTGRAAGTRKVMCSVCLTTHPGDGVRLMTARRARRGSDGDSVGLHMCSDLGCPLYVRGVLRPAPGGRLAETLPLQEQLDRMTGRLGAFLDRVTADR
jgi:hypothetical protein